jgi:putative transposase
MSAVTELAPTVGIMAACDCLGVARASYYRQKLRAGRVTEPVSRPVPARALQPEERAQVLAVLHEPRFQDRSPAAVQATLLDGRSISVLYPHHVSDPGTGGRNARAA